MVDRLAEDFRCVLAGEALIDFNLLVQETEKNNGLLVSNDEVKKKHPAAAEAYKKLVTELRNQFRTLQPC